MTADLRFRRVDRRDTDAIWTLHERAMRDAGTDPDDLPGTEDLRQIHDVYIDAGGEFIVGVGREESGRQPDPEAVPPRTFDGAVIAMGGFLPTTEGYDDERAIADERTAELHRMRVAPSHQREGHGHQLLVELEDRAIEAGFTRLVATTAARQRSAARFYPAQGYEEAGRSEYDEYELIHFEKVLAPESS